MSSGARVLVLGPTRLDLGGSGPTEVARTPAVLLARLAVDRGRGVPVAALHEAVWGPQPPATARTALHNQISRLRALAGHEFISTTSQGYVLGAGTDVDELVDTVHRAERLMDSSPEEALRLAEEALALPSGEPYADLSGHRDAWPARRRVESLLDAAADLEAEAALRLGLTARALGATARLHAASPLDERRAARHLRALEQAGRRGDAIAEAAAFRRVLRTEQGLEPGPEFDAAEAALLGAASSPPPARGLPGSTSRTAAVLTCVRAGRSVMVSGPARSGVTEVLQSVRKHLRSRVLVAAARANGPGDVAVAPLLDLLEELGVEPTPALGPVGTFVPSVSALAGSSPVVLIVDDADLAGPATRQSLVAAAGIPDVCLVVGVHDTNSGWLASLSPEQVRLDPAPVSDTVRLRELVRTLPGPVVRALTAVAVCGRHVPAATVRLLEAGSGLDEALALGHLSTPDGTTLTVEPADLAPVLLAEAPSGLVAEMRHTLGLWLAESGHHEESAALLIETAAIDPAATQAAVRAAAARGTAAGAHLDVAEWWQRAIEALTGLVTEDSVLQMRIEWGDALRQAGDARHVEILTDAIRDALATGSPDRVGEAMFAYLQLGGSATVNAAPDAMYDQLNLALKVLHGRPEEPVVRAAASLAMSMCGEVERCRELFVSAERAAHGSWARRQVLPFAYMSMGLPGDLPLRERYGHELVRLAGDADDDVARFEGLHLLFTTSLQRGDGSGLRASHAEMTRLVEAGVGDVGRRWALHYQQAALAHLDDDLAGAQQLSQAAYTQMRDIAEPRANAALFGQLFALELARGAVADLAPALGALVVDQPGVPAWHAAYALTLAGSEPATALHHVRESLRLVEPDFTWLAAHTVAGRAAATAMTLAGPDGGATLLLGTLRTLLEPYAGLFVWQGTCCYGPVDTALALLARALGDEPGARAHADHALTASERLGAPVFVRELRDLGW